MRMAKKPVGNAGVNRTNIEKNGAATMQYLPDLLGDTKDEIERTVVDRFVQAMTSATGARLKWRQNSENDLDFTLTTPGGDVDLELTELVIVDRPGPPFAPQNKLRKMGDRLSAVVNCGRFRIECASAEASLRPGAALPVTLPRAGGELAGAQRREFGSEA